MKASPDTLSALQCLFLERIDLFQATVASFAGHARNFYYNVLFAYYRCPRCGGQLVLTNPSEGTCTSCAATLDPTLQFQESRCCQAPLARHRLHYGCGHCGAVVPSRFLFDEKIFDVTYFRERVAASRERRRRSMEAMQMHLMAARTPPLFLTNVPEPGELEGLTDALDALVLQLCHGKFDHYPCAESFRMEEYRTLVLSRVRECILHFDAIPCICTDHRTDRVRRFTALVFMEHEREVALEQRGEDILVRAYAANTKG